MRIESETRNKGHIENEGRDGPRYVTNPFTPEILFVFSYHLPHNSYDVSLENLVLDQLVVP